METRTEAMVRYTRAGGGDPWAEGRTGVARRSGMSHELFDLLYCEDGRTPTAIASVTVEREDGAVIRYERA